jgi:hypothetical protein
MRRTPKIKEAMVGALYTAIEYLQHPDMPRLPRYESPSWLADALGRDAKLINAPGRLQEKTHVLGDLQSAADYLSNPKVTAIPFALRTSVVARRLREVIRDLK